MPTYLFLCTLKECQHEWEEFLNMSDPIPNVCPKCLALNSTKRLISGGSGRGKVVLTGNELKEKLDQEANEMRKEIYSNENSLANIIGEEKYHAKESYRDQVKKDSYGRPMIRFKK